ncbi:MAG: M20/M25/M40 family metallo-hydrolase, partial [Gemmatimonadetes bacterium]|nr:M20/M25/M40 family metallo-hydrolase [Gemmatimonadota bacterium]
SGYVAWQNGDYPHALERLERLLRAPGGDALLRAVALLTGELYTVEELAPDGRAVQWSPDGRFASYEAGAGGDVVTHVLALRAGKLQRLATVKGRNLVFAPAGEQAAYLSTESTPDLIAARVQLARATAANDGNAIRRTRGVVARLEAEHARVLLRNLGNGRERELPTPALLKWGLAVGTDGRVYVVGQERSDTAGRTDIYQLTSSAPRPLTSGSGLKLDLIVVPGGQQLVYTVDSVVVTIHDLASGETRRLPGVAPAVSADGSTLAYLTIGIDVPTYVTRTGGAPDRVTAAAGENTVQVLALRPGAAPVVVAKTAAPVANPVLSADGRLVAYQAMPRDDWELFVVRRDGSGALRLTQEIQHDLFPRFLGGERVLAVMGEQRHRRSYLYDVRTRERTRLFHNNTVRTVAPEYEWAPSPDGSRILVVSERDGDTISPDSAVYLVDLTRPVGPPEVLDRLRRNLAAERELRERGQRLFEPIAGEVRGAVADVSVARIYEYEKALYEFGSKHMTQPGNRPAIDYLAAMLRSFGYEPELQWFEPAPGIRTANVIATLPGTVNPELVYVVSSHFDSVRDGPGADDNTSGTTALLEAARVLRDRPMAATIKFAFFTGEEAGLRGSREFVRRAVASGMKLVGALNNDMIGWANDQRLDNTIRYSNEGIRDLQHAAAFLFTNLITYDAKYYKSTDAHAYYEAYGDIVGGIGSYPILGNPHYHQPHDILETIDHRLVAEVSKTTIASIMLMAASPARLAGLVARPRGAALELSWAAAPERGVREYVVAVAPAGGAPRVRLRVSEPRATLPEVAPGSVVAVKAVHERGLESWDWARATVAVAAGGR